MTTPRPVSSDVVLAFHDGIQDGAVLIAQYPPDAIAMPSDHVVTSMETRAHWVRTLHVGDVVNVYIVELPPERVIGLEADTLRFKYRLSGQIEAQEFTTEDKL